MPALNKSTFFAKLGVNHRKKVTIKGVGDVFVKALSLNEQEIWERSILDDDFKQRTDISLKASLIVATTENEAGEKLFTTDDIHELGQLQSGPLNKLFDEAQKLNNVTKDDIEELKKN